MCSLFLKPDEWTKKTGIKIFMRKNSLRLLYVRISPTELSYTKRLYCEKCKNRTIWRVLLKENCAFCTCCNDCYKIRFTGKKTSTSILRKFPVNRIKHSSTEN